MAQLLLVSSGADGSTSPDTILPTLGLLAHAIITSPNTPDALTAASQADVVVLDGRTELAGARTLCALFTAAGSTVPILLVLTEGGFAAVTPEWGVSDIVLDTAGPAEFDARLRLLTATNEANTTLTTGALQIDDSGYSATLAGQPLDLTFTEFELLKFLAHHPGRVFSREQLLADVWGYDYYGGTRTVDVHVRRLRAKLGPEHESLIVTVRNVGYRFSAPAD